MFSTAANNVRVHDGPGSKDCNHLRVSWREPPNTGGWSAVTAYLLAWRDESGYFEAGGDGKWLRPGSDFEFPDEAVYDTLPPHRVIEVAGDGPLVVTLGQLKPDTEYAVAVLPRNEYGWGTTWSDTAWLRTSIDSLPPAKADSPLVHPINSRCEAVRVYIPPVVAGTASCRSPTSFEVQLRLGAGNGHGPGQWSTVAPSEQGSTRASPSGGDVSLPIHDPARPFQVRVVANGAAGAAAPSDPTTVRPGVLQACVSERDWDPKHPPAVPKPPVAPPQQAEELHTTGITTGTTSRRSPSPSPPPHQSLPPPPMPLPSSQLPSDGVVGGGADEQGGNLGLERDTPQPVAVEESNVASLHEVYAGIQQQPNQPAGQTVGVLALGISGARVQAGQPPSNLARGVVLVVIGLAAISTLAVVGCCAYMIGGGHFRKQRYAKVDGLTRLPRAAGDEGEDEDEDEDEYEDARDAEVAAALYNTMLATRAAQSKHQHEGLTVSCSGAPDPPPAACTCGYVEAGSVAVAPAGNPWGELQASPLREPADGASARPSGSASPELLTTL